MTNDIITRARAVLDRASSGPWYAEGRDDASCRGMTVLVDGSDQIVGTVNGNDPDEHQFTGNDVDAIIISHNMMEHLLDVLLGVTELYSCPLCGGTDGHDSMCEVGRALSTLRTELDRVGAL